MTALQRTEHSRYSTRQIFDLIADVEKYPEFLPWCSAARVTERNGETEAYAELVIAFKAIREKYTSHIQLTPPTHDSAPCSVQADMVEGPFHHLSSRWELTPGEEGGTDIHLTLDFRFKSALLEKLIGGLFGKASEKMVGAFRQRARELYGGEL